MVRHTFYQEFFSLIAVYSCIIISIIHCYNQLFMTRTVDGCNQALIRGSITAAGGELPPLCCPPDISFLTGEPVTSESTFMNYPLIINVEGGGLAFHLARHRGALYLVRRRKLLLIYEDTLPLCVASYNWSCPSHY